MVYGLKGKEILTYLFLIVIGYFIAKMFSRMYNCGNGFSVGGQEQTCDINGLNEVIITNCRDSRGNFDESTCENTCKEKYNIWYDHCNENETNRFNELKRRVSNRSSGFDIDGFYNLCTAPPPMSAHESTALPPMSAHTISIMKTERDILSNCKVNFKACLANSDCTSNLNILSDRAYVLDGQDTQDGLDGDEWYNLNVLGDPLLRSIVNCPQLHKRD